MKTRTVLTAGQVHGRRLRRGDAGAGRPDPAGQHGGSLAPQFVLQARHELGAILCGADAGGQLPAGRHGRLHGHHDPRLAPAADGREVDRGRRAGAQRRRTPPPTSRSSAIPYQAWIKQPAWARASTTRALAAIDYRTGQVYAYAGSAGFYLKGNKKFQPQFDVLEDGWRQPGSAFKPINYIDRHRRPDADRRLHVHGRRHRLRGRLQADRRRPPGARPGPPPPGDPGLAQHPRHQGGDPRSARTRVCERAKDFGIRCQTSTFPGGASIAIGTVEVHMIDLISAYGAIANGGVLVPRTTILEVRDSERQDDLAARRRRRAGKRVVSAQAAFIMTDILAGNTEPRPEPVLEQAGDLRRRQAASRDAQDRHHRQHAATSPPSATSRRRRTRSCPALVVGAWMGNSDNSARRPGAWSPSSRRRRCGSRS